METKNGTAAVEGTFRIGTSADPRWLVSPWFDLLFIANVAWLAALAAPLWLDASGESTGAVEFWQIYFLTTPHRWLTLVLVATDPDRRGGRRWAFVAPAVLALLVIVGVRAGTGALTCLALVDYVWNTWHFGAQHGGILRMYSRRVPGGRPRWETIAIRTLVVYTGLRLAGWSTGWTETYPAALDMLRMLDLLVLLAPASLLIMALQRGILARAGKTAYLASVCCLYSALLVAVRDGHHAWVMSLAVASAAFHAVEYLAIVTYYAERRRDQGSAAPFQAMARHWFTLLAIYMVLLGVLAMFATRHLAELWLGVNLWAAALHYTYDGMIWKLRRPDTAKALGVELPTAAAPASPT